MPRACHKASFVLEGFEVKMALEVYRPEESRLGVADTKNGQVGG